MLTPHPIAAHFPRLEGDDYVRFRADIEKRGLIEPIWLYEGKILDGCNRYRACCELDIEIKTREYTGDCPMGFSWSLNGERRHLTHAQKTIVALELLPELEAEARKRQMETLKQYASVTPPMGERQSIKGEAIDAAAAVVGVCGSSVQQAKAVRTRDPETFEKIKSGELTVATAYKRIAKPRAAAGPDQKPSRNQPRAQRIADIQRLSAEGNRPEQIAKQLGISAEWVRQLAIEENLGLIDTTANSRHINIDRVIEQTIIALEGCALGIQVINGQLQDISPLQARHWADSLNDPLKTLSTLRKKLLEIAQ